MNEYVVDQCYDFPIDTSADINEDFFRILLNDGVELRLPKFLYQRGKPLPTTVYCRVKMIRDGIPVLSHVPAQHVYRLYSDRDWARESYDFKVTHLPQAKDGPYELTDSNGIIFRLADNEARLALGQRVRCRFVRLTERNFMIVRDYAEDALQYLSIDDILGQLSLSPVLVRFLHNFLQRTEAMERARAEMREMRAGWAMTAMQGLRAGMADLFATARVPRNARALRAMFGALRDAALMLLENSEFLRNSSGDTRAGMQRQLTETAESVDPYLRAISLLTQGTDQTYIMGLMEKLRKSGYLYHPKLQFGTMMAIFRLKPALIKKALGSIYDAVMQWQLNTWTVEPFRSAFVEQFEIYVEDARHRIDELPQPETEADFDNLENVLTAIALQLHIADADTYEAYSLNRSRLYRYAALARPRSAEALLDKALHSLMSGGTHHLEFGYDSIKNYTMMVTALSTPLHEAQKQFSGTRVLRAGHVAVELSADGISLRRTDEADPRPVLPNGSMTWLTPQIYLEGVEQLSAAKLRKYQAHQELWKQIELALLEERATPAASERLRRAEPGDEVEIRVISAEADRFGSNPRLICEIIDPCFEHDKGYLYRSDIVDYKVKNFDPRCYTGTNGKPLSFWAEVKECDSEGRYIFTLKDAADQLVRTELANRTDEMLAVITVASGTRYSAIGDRGFGFFIDKSYGFENLEPQTYVRVRLTDIPVEGNIVAEIVDYAHDGETVSKDDTLVYLMRQLGAETDDDADDEIMRDSDELLSVDELLEIVEMLRFHALSTPQLLAAVDYLGLARVLALVAGDERTARMLHTHMALLGQHQFYADNTRIDTESLDALAPAVKEHPLLERIFSRLRIVSWLGDPHSLESLAPYVNSPRNELEGKLARLVSSYNMLASGDLEDTENLKFIKKRIASLLGVNSDAQHLKHYGSESQYVEFKSSIVFPALRKGETFTGPDPDRQHQEILEIIAGFLNSTGGTLFLGVNDQHYEKGLADDLAYLSKFKNIRSLDNLCVHIDNLVRSSYDLGTTVGNYVHVSVDDESERGVIIIKVDPSRRPVLLGGNIFVRQSSSTVPMLDESRTIFMADRARRYDEMMRIAGLELADDDNDSDDDSTAADTAKNTPVTPVAVEDAENHVDPIATSAWRHNVLHSYEDGYSAPACYIYFNDKGEIKYSTTDMYCDTDKDCTLALTVSPDDVDQGGYLVMAFAGERVAKVPLREIFEKPENSLLRYWDGAPLEFASVARPGDGLMCVLADSNDGLSARCTLIDRIDESRLTAQPPRILSMPVAYAYRWGQVAASALPHLTNYMADNLSQRQIGYTLRTRAGMPATESIVRTLFASCKPE